MNLSKNVKVSQIRGYYAAGTSARTSSIIDMAGYEGVMFIANFGTIINTGTIAFKAQQNTINSASGMADISGATKTATVTSTTAAYTQSCMILDVFQPVEEFLQVVITPAIQNAVILGVVAIQYSAKDKPPTNDASVLAALMVQPAA